MQQASGGQQQMEQLLLLWRIVQHQKRLNNETRRADDARQTQRQDVLRQLAGQLAARQGRIRREAERLEEMLAARSQRAAAVVEQAGMKMEASRAGLRRADTSERTRTPQIQAVALLEALMEQQKSQCQGAAGAAAMARMQAMMQMMAAGAAGQAGGGFFGGANAPIAPSEAGPVDDEQWRKVRGRFEEQLGSGAEGEYPPQFRSLLNAYFDRLRAEPGE